MLLFLPRKKKKKKKKKRRKKKRKKLRFSLSFYVLQQTVEDDQDTRGSLSLFFFFLFFFFLSLCLVSACSLSIFTGFRGISTEKGFRFYLRRRAPGVPSPPSPAGRFASLRNFMREDTAFGFRGISPCPPCSFRIISSSETSPCASLRSLLYRSRAFLVRILPFGIF